jgi:Zn-dependent alcohol dehydrogenase
MNEITYCQIAPTELNGTIQDVVKNIIICNDYETADMLTKSMYGENSYVIDTTQYNIKIGYTYLNGVFSSDTNDKIITDNYILYVLNQVIERVLNGENVRQVLSEYTDLTDTQKYSLLKQIEEG